MTHKLYINSHHYHIINNMNITTGKEDYIAASSAENPPSMVHEAFHAQANTTPHAPCLVDAVTGKVWTYRETQLKVLSLASELRDAGTMADKVVAIYMDPSPRYVVSMLAALSAGGAVSTQIIIECVSLVENGLFGSSSNLFVLHNDSGLNKSVLSIGASLSYTHGGACPQ